jgi:hypothetical protein
MTPSGGDGKEGISGSSPEEGFREKSSANTRKAVDDCDLWVRLRKLCEPHLHVLRDQSVLGLVMLVIRRKTIARHGTDATDVTRPAMTARTIRVAMTQPDLCRRVAIPTGT